METIGRPYGRNRLEGRSCATRSPCAATSEEHRLAVRPRGAPICVGIWDVYIVDHTFLQISAYMRDMYMYMVYDHLCVQVWASSIIVEAETLTLNLPLLKP